MTPTESSSRLIPIQVALKSRGAEVKTCLSRPRRSNPPDVVHIKSNSWLWEHFHKTTLRRVQRRSRCRHILNCVRRALDTFWTAYVVHWTQFELRTSCTGHILNCVPFDIDTNGVRFVLTCVISGIISALVPGSVLDGHLCLALC